VPTIISYQKFITQLITRDLLLPTTPDSTSPLGTELATIDGTTYVSLPDGVTLSKEQPVEIKDSISEIVLTDTLRALIKTSSPHVRLIDSRVRAKIAEKYSITDELKLLRTPSNADYSLYSTYVEECRAWGQGEKAKLGL
jgi:hypothetical protein